MRRLFPRVHVGFSTIALLGASTILLAAAGETLWHANAAAGERWVPAATGVETAASAEASANAAMGMTMTDPLFKPFVYLELPMPENCTLVQTAGVHINNDGVVVATINNGSSYRGYIWYDELFADGWQGPLEDASGEIDLNSYGLRGINDELEICGTRNNSGPKAFFLALSSTYTGTLTQIGTANGYANDINNQGVVIGTGASGTPVGWWDIIGSPVTLPALSGGDVTNALGVTPNTTLGNSLVVGQCKDSNSKYQAVVWYFDTSWQITDLTGITGSQVGFAVDVNDDDVIVGGKLSGGSISDTILWYYDGSSSQWVGVSQGTSTDFIPEAINDQQYPEVVGENYLWICDDVASGTGTQIDLSAYALGLPTNMINMNCTDINDAGEIVGVGQLGSGGAWVAFKLVPYDVNNNGESDVREIALDIEDDANGNWLIDWAEDIRVGLHSPPYQETVADDIEYTSVVRLPLHLTVLAEDLPSEEYALNLILQGESACQDFRDQVNRWSRGSGSREIVIWLRSSLNDDPEFHGFDFLPEDDIERDGNLANIKKFGYQFAHCIDYVQTGNEVFTGAGRYLFRNSDIDGCSWEGEAVYYDLDGVRLNVNPGCAQDAFILVRDWLEDQAWAALEGSALAGRPLRIIGPGIPFGTVLNAHGEQTLPLFIMTNLVPWLNDNQMLFDTHIHYEDISDVTNTVDDLTDTEAPWEAVPNWMTALEWGPRASGAWATANHDDFVRYRNDEGCDPGPPENCCWDDPGQPWEDFSADWRDDSQNGFNGDFEVDTALMALVNAEFTVACYGPTGMQSPSLMTYDMAALWGNRICNNGGGITFITDTDKFTPLKYLFTDEADSYTITFPESRQGCPDCPEDP